MTRRTSSVRKLLSSSIAAILAGGCMFAAPRVAQACTPYGLIGAKWSALGGNSGPLGPCISDEFENGVGGRIQQFQYGWVNWHYPDTQAYAVWGNIAAAWTSRYGGPSIGQPANDQSPVTRARWNSPPITFVAQYSAFYDASTNAYTYLVWEPGAGEPFGGAQGEHPCQNSDNVCIVSGVIAQKWQQMLSDPGSIPIGPPQDDPHYDGVNTTTLIQDFQIFTMLLNQDTGQLCFDFPGGHSCF